MALPAEKLAASLQVLLKLQHHGKVAIQSRDLSRTHRERLVLFGYLKPVMKGWYIPSRPEEPTGESIAWNAAFWDFCAAYLNDRFGDDWCMSAEQSLLRHTGVTTTPDQLVVRSPKANNNLTELPFDTSILDLRTPIPERIEQQEDLRFYELHDALIACSPSFFRNHPDEARAALGMVTDASELLERLLAGGHSQIAGRLMGAFRNIGRHRIADDIQKAMTALSYKMSATDPFATPSPMIFTDRDRSPQRNRLRLLWREMRTGIADYFVQPSGPPYQIGDYLNEVEDLYVTDAYHSLSIEGYRVSDGLIERVRSGAWDPHNIEQDHAQKDAMAARGYWQAFQKVKSSLLKVLQGENPGDVIAKDHSSWYLELMQPSVQAGILKASDLAGYRNYPIYIRHSKHVPPAYSGVPDLMDLFFELLAEETDPAVRVVLGHFVFVFIHPYMDGNGRLGRFIMNLLLAAGGYSWRIVTLEERQDYLESLEKASVRRDINPFAAFLAKDVHLFTGKQIIIKEFKRYPTNDQEHNILN